MGWTGEVNGEQLQELVQRIRYAGTAGMQREFKKQIKEAGNSCVEALGGAVMGVTVSRGLDTYARRWDGTQFVLKENLRKGRKRSTGLRARVAESIGISQTRKGIRIQASARKIGAYGASLPRYLDGTLPRNRRWRHPVFGRRDSQWVEQRGDPWFFVTITRHRAGFEKAVQDVMTETEKELTK